MTETKQAKKTVEELVSELLKVIGIDADYDIRDVSGQTEQAIEVNINSDEETGLLIGSHGSTLAAIESFLSIATRQKLGDWVRITVNIGDWKQKQEEHLSTLAQQAANRAKATGEAQNLYNLTASQRRIIHLRLSEDLDVITESKGEGTERYLVVRPK